MKILFRRMGAFGDVVQTTPIVARYSAQYPEAEIHFVTHYPDIFRNSAHVKVVNPTSGGWYDTFYDLDMAYENTLRKMGGCDAYSMKVFGDVQDSYELNLNFGEAPDIGVDYTKAIAFCPAVSWPQRTQPREWWQKFADTINENGYTPISMGTAVDHILTNVKDTRGNFDCLQQGAIINACLAYASTMSGLMEIALATDVGIVALFTQSQPGQYKFKRKWEFRKVIADIECAGCEGTYTEPLTYFPCRRGDNKCITLFDPVNIAQQTIEIAQQRNN